MTAPFLGQSYNIVMPKALMIVGGVLFAVGAWMAYGPKVPGVGKLPGDLVIRHGPVTVYIPIVTCLILSIVVTLLMRWFGPK